MSRASKKQTGKGKPKSAPKAAEPSPVLAHFPAVPPPPVTNARLPEPGQPGSWDDELARLPATPETASVAGSYWINTKNAKEWWRFEPDGMLTYSILPGPRVYWDITWQQRGPWLLNVYWQRGAEYLARIDGDRIAGYHRHQLGMLTFEYRRATSKEAASIDDKVRAWLEKFGAALAGTRLPAVRPSNAT